MLNKFYKLSEKMQISLVCLVAFIMYLAGNNMVPVTDPVECNYTECALEMLQANDWFSTRIHGNPWFDKPIFIFLTRFVLNAFEQFATFICFFNFIC